MLHHFKSSQYCIFDSFAENVLGSIFKTQIVSIDSYFSNKRNYVPLTARVNPFSKLLVKHF